MSIRPILAIHCVLAAALAFAGENVITVGASNALYPTSPDLWGIFFEDIDLSLDGGVYAELVRNRSFEDGNGVNTNVIENVQASAVRDRDGSVILKVANCTEEPQAIRVEGVKGQAVKTLFGGGDAMAHNSPAEPEALKESVSEIDFDGTDTLPPLSLVIYKFRP